MTLDAHQIAGKLYVGSAPPVGNHSKHFDMIYFVGDFQPDPYHFPGVEVRKIPFDDSPIPSTTDLHAMSLASASVARNLSRGKRVLVTCRMGRNRSAMVAALALKRLCRIPGKKAYEIVRSKRVDPAGVRALENPAFARMLKNLP